MISTTDPSGKPGQAQVADFLSFMFRRFAELSAGVGSKPFQGEQARMDEWISEIAKYSITPRVYPKSGRTSAHDIFWSVAPSAIRLLT